MRTHSAHHSDRRSRRSPLLGAALLLALVVGLMPIVNGSTEAEAASCSTTLSPGANVASALRSAKNGAVVCLRDGSYGSLTVNASRSGFVTLRSVNPLKAVFDRITLDDASYVRFERLTVKQTIRNGEDNSHHIEIAGSRLGGVAIDAPTKSQESSGPSHWVIEYNDIPNCKSHCVALLSGDPNKYRPISTVVIRGNKIGPMSGGQDAIRVHNWRNVSVLDNEIFGVIEDGQHNDCLQSVWGGSGMVFAGNYLHDNNCQTFFLKDGYTSDVTVANNLSLRNRKGSASVVGKIYPTGGFTMRNNTLWDSAGFYLRSRPHGGKFPTGAAYDYEIKNNVIVNFIPYDDATSNAGSFASSNLVDEDYNVFGKGWTWVPKNMGKHSIEDSSPSFVKQSSNAGQDASYGDWRLKSKVSAGGATFSAGITWKLAGRQFGTKAFGKGNAVGAGGATTSAPLSFDGTFSDDDRSVHESAIEALAAAGITKGCAPNRFCPTSAVTRGSMAAFLVRSLDLPGTKVDYFKDDGDSMFEREINILAAAGIVKGCNPPGNDRFCPDSPTTRGAMAAMLSRALDLDPASGSRFGDDNGHVFEGDIEAIAAAGITKGCNPPSNTKFCPNRVVTREQLASLLVRAFDY